MHSPWPQVRRRAESASRTLRTPKTRRPRSVRLPALTGSVYPRVRQYLFDLREPADVRVLSVCLCEPVQDVYQALRQLANAGCARHTDTGWVYVRHAERATHGR